MSWLTIIYPCMQSCKLFSTILPILCKPLYEHSGKPLPAFGPKWISYFMITCQQSELGINQKDTALDWPIIIGPWLRVHGSHVWYLSRHWKYIWHYTEHHLYSAESFVFLSFKRYIVKFDIPSRDKNKWNQYPYDMRLDDIYCMQHGSDRVPPT